MFGIGSAWMRLEAEAPRLPAAYVASLSAVIERGESPRAGVDAASREGSSAVAPPRVLQVFRADGWSGAEIQVANLALQTHPHLVEQTVSMLVHSPARLADTLAEQGIPVRPVASRFGLVGNVARLVRVLRERRPEVIEAYGFRASVVARAAAPFGGRPAVVVGVGTAHFTAGEIDDPSARFARLVERLLERWTCAYAANSHAAERFLLDRGIPPEKLTVIPNGVDIDVPQASPGAEGTPLVVCVARLDLVKRQSVLLRALGRLQEKGLEFACELIGAGPSAAALASLARELRIDDVLEMTGHLPPQEVPPRLARAHVFVLPSATEGMPGAVMEGMAAGLPVVATRVGDTGKLVREGETGFLVEPDDVEGLAAALEQLILDPSLRARFGAAGRDLIQDFSYERFAARKARFYRRIADERNI